MNWKRKKQRSSEIVKILNLRSTICYSDATLKCKFLSETFLWWASKFSWSRQCRGKISVLSSRNAEKRRAHQSSSSTLCKQDRHEYKLIRLLQFYWISSQLWLVSLWQSRLYPLYFKVFDCEMPSIIGNQRTLTTTTRIPQDILF